MPSVSIILCTYNRAGYLKDAIESVVAQTFTDWELILVIDGSTDNTEEVVQSHVKQDQRIRSFRKANENCSAIARNYGLGRARGKYVAFLDDDDRWLSKKLERQVNFMESHPEIGMCYTQFQIYRSHGDYLEPTKVFPEFPPSTFQDFFNAFVPPSTVLMRKSCLNQTGWFDSRYRACEDFDLWLRFTQRWNVAFIDGIHVFTVMDERDHGGKDPIQVSKVTSEIIKNLELIPECKKYERYLRLQIAQRIYEIGRIYLDEGDYWKATQYFVKALWTDPLVGLAVRRPGEEGAKLFLRILKAYLAVPACLLKGLVHAKR